MQNMIGSVRKLMRRGASLQDAVRLTGNGEADIKSSAWPGNLFDKLSRYAADGMELQKAKRVTENAQSAVPAEGGAIAEPTVRQSGVPITAPEAPGQSSPDEDLLTGRMYADAYHSGKPVVQSIYAIAQEKASQYDPNDAYDFAELAGDVLKEHFRQVQDYEDYDALMQRGKDEGVLPLTAGGLTTKQKKKRWSIMAACLA